MCFKTFSEKEIKKKYGKYDGNEEHLKYFVTNPYAQHLPMLTASEMIWHQIQYRHFHWEVVDGQLGIVTNVRSDVLTKERMEAYTKNVLSAQPLMKKYKETNSAEDLNNLLEVMYGKKIPNFAQRSKEEIEYVSVQAQLTHAEELHFYNKINLCKQYIDKPTFIPISKAENGKITFKYAIDFKNTKFLENLLLKASSNSLKEKTEDYLKQIFSRVSNVDFELVDQNSGQPHLTIIPFENPYKKYKFIAGITDINPLYEHKSAYLYLDEEVIKKRVPNIGVHEIGHFFGFRHPDEIVPERLKTLADNNPYYNRLANGLGCHSSNCDAFDNNLGYRKVGKSEGNHVMPIMQATLDETIGAHDPFPQTNGQVIFSLDYDENSPVDMSISSKVIDGQKMTYVKFHLCVSGATIYNPDSGEENVLDLSNKPWAAFTGTICANGFLAHQGQPYRLFSFGFDTKIHEIRFPELNIMQRTFLKVKDFENIRFQLRSSQDHFLVRSANNSFILSLQKGLPYEKDFEFHAANKVVLKGQIDSTKIHFLHARNRDLMITSKEKGYGQLTIRFSDYFNGQGKNFSLQCKNFAGELTSIKLPTDITKLAEYR